MKNAAIEDLIPHYLEYLDIERGMSPLSIKIYVTNIGRFAQYMGGRPIRQIEYKHVSAYRKWLKENYKVNDHDTHLIALNAMLRLARRLGIKTNIDSVEVPSIKSPPMTFLYPEEIKRMYKVAKTHRDKLIVMLLFDTGMRVAELANLKPSNVNFKHREARIVGKGNKPRVVFFTQPTGQMLEAWFAEHDSLEITSRQIQRIVTGLAEKAGIRKRVSPHTLRHSFATNLLNNGADMRFLQVMLGHESVSTTEIYTHIANPKLREVYNKNMPGLLGETVKYNVNMKRPLTRKQKAFADYLLNNPKASGTEAIKATYSLGSKHGTTSKRGEELTASVMATENLAKPNILAYMLEKAPEAELRVLQLMRSENEPIALAAAKDVLDRTHGRAVQRTESTSTSVNIAIDLSGSRSERE